jgi:hypothetical protein
MEVSQVLPMNSGKSKEWSGDQKILKYFYEING